MAGPAVAELHIVLFQDGRVEVTGPIANDFLCYGALEKAKDAVRSFCAEQARNQSSLVVPTPVVPADVGGPPNGKPHRFTP